MDRTNSDVRQGRDMRRRRLTRSKDGIVAGVCGGIAEYMDFEPSVVRVGYAALSVFSAAFPGLLLYIIMWFIIPKSDNIYE